MTLSRTRPIVGIDNVSFYNRTNGELYGKPLQVLGTLNLNITQELKKQTGGSAVDPWHIIRGLRTNENTLSLREYPSYLFQILYGKASTDNGAEVAGNTSTVINKYGTTVISAITGIATSSTKAAKKGDLKHAAYLIKAVSATTVDVYMLAFGDRVRAVALTPEDDYVKITASPLTISTGVAVEILNTGVELTGGSGGIALTIGDTAFFETRPINTGSTEGIIGADAECFSNFGLFMQSEIDDDGGMWMFEAANVAAGGVPLPMVEKDFAESELAFEMAKGTFLDGTNGMLKYRYAIAPRVC